MKHPLGMWMLDNAELFRYAGELRCMREEAERILLSGDASAFLAPLFREMYPESTIIASSPDQAVLDDAASDDPALVKDLCDIRGAVYEDISIAVSVLALSRLWRPGSSQGICSISMTVLSLAATCMSLSLPMTGSCSLR